MTSRSNPEWLNELIAQEGDSKLIDLHERDLLLEALGSASHPQSLDAQQNQKLIQNALIGAAKSTNEGIDDPFAPATDEERVAAARTRDRLETDAMVLLLRTAHKPTSLVPARELARRRTALAQAPIAYASKRNVTKALSWGVFAVAAAAAIWLSTPKFWYRPESLLPHGTHSDLALSRTTKPLFTLSFALSTPSERIDRIAQLREKELRHNRYALWGLP